MTNPSFVSYIDSLRKMDLLATPLTDLLEILDNVLAQGSPLVAKSLNKPASDKSLKRLANAVGKNAKLPSALITWFKWHDGQKKGAHRILTPKDDMRRPVSADEAADMLLAARNHLQSNEDAIESWCPLWVFLPSGDTELKWQPGMYFDGDDRGKINIRSKERKQPQYANLQHMVVALVEKFIDLAIPPAPGQYWVHGVGAPLTELNEHHHVLPGGLWPLASGSAPISILKNFWSVHTPKELKSTLDWLIGSGHREGSKTPQKYLAWDLCRAANLAGLGRVATWLSAEDAWKYQYDAACEIQKCYSSWSEMAQSYTSGCKKFMGSSDGDYMERLFADPTSPFQLPWNTPLSSTPTPDIPPDRIDIGPGEFDKLELMLGCRLASRLLVVQLEPGVYTLDNGTLERPCHIVGATNGETILQGMVSKKATLSLDDVGAKIENVTILHEPEDEKEDAAMALTALGSLLIVNDCRITGSRLGMTLRSSSWMQMRNCSIRSGNGHKGLNVANSYASIHSSQIDGSKHALSAGTTNRDGKTILEITNCALQAGKFGAVLTNVTATMVETTIVAQELTAVLLNEQTSLRATGCRFRSLKSECIETRQSKQNATDEPSSFRAEPSALLVKCELGPGHRSACIHAGGTLDLHDCTVFNTTVAFGGVIHMRNCDCTGPLWANEGGYLSLDNSVVKFPDKNAAGALKNSRFRARNSQFFGKVISIDQGQFRATHCEFHGTDDGATLVLETGGRAVLDDCDLLLGKSDASMTELQKDTTLLATNCRFSSNSAATMLAVQNEARFWRCEFSNTNAEGITIANYGNSLFYNCKSTAIKTSLATGGGRSYFYHSVLRSETTGIYIHGPAQVLISNSTVIAPKSLTSDTDDEIYLQNGTLDGTVDGQTEQLPATWDDWEGFSVSNPTTIRIDVNAVPQEVKNILNKMTKWGFHGPNMVVHAAIGMVCPDVPLTVTSNKNVLTIEGKDPVPTLLQEVIVDLFTDEDETPLALWTIAPDDLSGEDLYPEGFTIGPMHELEDDTNDSPEHNE